MIPKELIKKIKKIQITTSKLATDVFAGQYQSVFKGKGMEFYEVREYQMGDDIRSIDWNVTARTGHPFVKKYIEERELTVMLLVDVSASSFIGSKTRLKSSLIAELAAVLGFSALQNNDKVGLILFTDRIELSIPARKGIRHIVRIIREILYFKPHGKGTDIGLALEYLSRVLKRKCICFLISDFLVSDIKKPLSITHKRHDIIAVTVSDPIEEMLPKVGIICFEDAETGKKVYIDSLDMRAVEAFRKKTVLFKQERNKLFQSIGMDAIHIRTDRRYEKELIGFFKRRERKLRWG